MSGSYSCHFGHSEIGPLHIRNNTNNQDSWAVKHFDWGDIIAVSDGVGSKELSEFGSKAACEAAIKLALFWNKNPEETKEQLIDKYHSIWINELGSLKPDTCNCTILWAIRKGNELFIAQLGDGILATVSHKNEIDILIANSNSTSFSNQTDALQTKNNINSWSYKSINSEKINALLLMTDGISDDLIESQQKPFVQSLIQHYCRVSSQTAKAEIEQWLNEWPVPNHQDDKTLACIYKPEEYGHEVRSKN